MIFEIPKAWVDGCNHPPETYVGSFEYIGNKYDVYVGPFGILDRDSVCIRYGNDCSEYMSPGTLDLFIKCAAGIHSGEYGEALQLILAKGKLTWQRK